MTTTSSLMSAQDAGVDNRNKSGIKTTQPQYKQSFFRSPRARWTGVSVGLLLAAVCFQLIYPYWLGPYAKEAKAMGLPVKAFVDLSRINADSTKRPLTASEINRLRETTKDKNSDIRMLSVILLANGKRSQRRNDVVELAFEALHDENPLVRMNSIAVLDKLDVPNILSIAIDTKQNDTAEIVRARAQRVLDKRSLNSPLGTASTVPGINTK